jgi:hypothetical protein
VDLPEDPAGAADADRFLQRGQMRVDDLIQFSPDSARPEMFYRYPRACFSRDVQYRPGLVQLPG